MPKPPSAQQTYEAQCQGKTPHATRAAAEAQIDHLAKRGKRRNFTIYPCAYGNHFHVAHANGK